MKKLLLLLIPMIWIGCNNVEPEYWGSEYSNRYTTSNMSFEIRNDVCRLYYNDLQTGAAGWWMEPVLIDSPCQLFLNDEPGRDGNWVALTEVNAVNMGVQDFLYAGIYVRFLDGTGYGWGYFDRNSLIGIWDVDQARQRGQEIDLEPVIMLQIRKQNNNYFFEYKYPNDSEWNLRTAISNDRQVEDVGVGLWQAAITTNYPTVTGSVTFKYFQYYQR